MFTTQWEYKDLYGPSNEDVSEAGAEGWEAFAVTMQKEYRSYEEPRDIEVYHFKRPKLPSYIAVTGTVPD